MLELVILGLSILLLSASVLSFRLGFDVFDGYDYFSIILKTISQQGATFEVVFGAVNFLKEINSCISYYDYFIEGVSFGDCVDVSRGVNFFQGGFASSFFAELFYFWPIAVIIIPLFAFSLRLTNTAYNHFLSIGYSYKTGALFVFFLLPNLVYFARSSVFDLIEKSLLSIFFIVFLSLMLKFLRKENG
ncbi:hypothetical protein J7I09_004547 [Vibrio vulnificus]|nr:hypothetical protein [Vibrio vulnificus]